MKYRIEETKGFTKTVGNYVVKRNGKVDRYFDTSAEAHDYVQACLIDREEQMRGSCR
jgi:hypothetical protein